METIMEKTADLAMIQKTNTDTLLKESKSQRVITERCGCLQSAVSKHIKCKVEIWVGKGAQATGMTDSNTCESFTRSGLKLESVHQESPRSDVFRKSKFCISFGNQGPRVWRKSGEAQNPCCLKSSVKFPQSVMIWAAMSSAGVGPLCFLKSTVNAAIYQQILEHFMLPSADKLYGEADFIFQQDLAPVHTAKVVQSGGDEGMDEIDALDS
ncbi:hypothetical protein M9458_050577 [Cirrhinus mrigala]|uniref:Transposase n=1 Tax=Cirrhinus mrigala TaxID=683832 RepID=A0ABD0MVU1_CIRMR